jgi:hypothetical protein
VIVTCETPAGTVQLDDPVELAVHVTVPALATQLGVESAAAGVAGRTARPVTTRRTAKRPVAVRWRRLAIHVRLAPALRGPLGCIPILPLFAAARVPRLRTALADNKNVDTFPVGLERRKNL